jgi:predicted membrane chloride channel (bestrophin family)
MFGKCEIKNILNKNWYAPDKIQFFMELVGGILEATKEQLRQLEKAKGKAHVLDDATIQLVLKSLQKQHTHIAFLKEQSQRWWDESLTDKQYQPLRQLDEKITALERTCQQISFLAEHYQHHTIDKILKMSPEELLLALLNQQIDWPE